MRKSAWALVVAVVIIAGSGVSAKTPDGVTPSRETICDNETGAAYGLCTAYCEAMDCGDPNQRASDTACEAVRRNYEKKTGRPIPCAVQCPCFTLLQLFADILSEQAVVERCVADSNLLFVVVDTGDFVLIDSGVVPSCSVNAEPPFVDLTPMESLACRVKLRQIVEAQGIVCEPPE
jgi:hypothetical protein